MTAGGDRGRPEGPVYAYPPYPPEDEVDLMDYARVVYARRRLVLSIVGACTAAALLVAFLLPPMYRATAVIAPVEENPSGGMASLMGELGGLAPLAGVQLNTTDPTQKQIAILTSRAFTAKVVDENDLMPLLFADRWDPVAKRWKVTGDDVPDMWDAFRLFEDIREVRDDPKTGLVSVSVTWGDPELAAKWVGLHIDTLNRFLQAQAVREAEKSVDYLMEQVDRTSNVELRQTLFNLVEAQTKKAMLARTRDDFAFKVIDPAVPPDEPSSPQRVLIVFSTLVASTLLGIVAAFVAEAVARGRADSKGAGDDAAPPAPGPAADSGA